jgi:hypothetical protein
MGDFIFQLVVYGVPILVIALLVIFFRKSKKK